jgi:hypothetical protein
MNTQTLTLEQLKQQCPTAFTAQKSPDTTTDRYTHIPTSVVIEDLMKLGWEPTSAKQVKARKNVGYQKHLITFRNPDIMIKGNEGDDVQPTVLLTNSHDGKNAFNFQVGLIRFICENGLVVSDEDYAKVQIRHVGYSFEELQTKINDVIAKLPNLVEKINTFKSTELTNDQVTEFAEKASQLRFSDSKSETYVDLNGLLVIERKEDEGNNLWSVFNRVQEKLINGTFNYDSSSTYGVRKNRKARSIKNFNQDIKINKELWELANEYVLA